jgi:hypothetical protein
MPTERRQVAEYRPRFRGADLSKTKSDLYKEAKNAGIKGRSAMSKSELVAALLEHRAASSSRERATRQAPGPDRCAIAYQESGRNGEFRVVVTEIGGSTTCVARSPAFPAPRFGPVRRWGRARAAHDLLVSRLEACGWWPVDAGATWHELAFVRLRGQAERSRRSVVRVGRQAGQARFLAEELDGYGNPTPMLVSAPFRAPRFRRVRPSMEAKAELKQLVRRMESRGWRVAAVGKDWYAVSLWRPATAKRGPRPWRSRPGRPASDAA